MPTAAAMSIAATFSLQCREKVAANVHYSLKENAWFLKSQTASDKNQQ